MSENKIGNKDEIDTLELETQQMKSIDMDTQNKASSPNKEEKMFKEEIYDRLPFTYKQVDIFTKVIIGFTIAFVIFSIIVSNLN